MTEQNDSSFIGEIEKYYSDRIREYGETPQGVDWNGEESQTLRFEQLCKLIKSPRPFTINDLGCGYGAFFEYISKKDELFSYTGIDISADMISAATRRYKNNENARFVVSDEPVQIADYGVASGIFNVRLNRTDMEWQKYLETTLDALDRTSRLGFSFNCLTSYSDSEKMRDYLYYADPCKLFDFCKRHYSRNVSILHDYNLYEFTILVRK